MIFYDQILLSWKWLVISDSLPTIYHDNKKQIINQQYIKIFPIGIDRYS